MNLDDKIQNRKKGCLYGLAIGDALGAAIEFQYPGEFELVSDYRDGGPFDLAPGEWTDDTSMALALADALNNSTSVKDQLDNYIEWYRTGKYSVNNRCFDIGNATRSALHAYEANGNLSASTSIELSGNGSIMRLAPIAIKFAGKPDLSRFAAESSRTTHGSPLCVSACVYMANVLSDLILGESKEDTLHKYVNIQAFHPSILEVIKGDYKRGECKGTGYVVESLRSALWAFWNSDSFEETVLKAVNLGNDSDTTGAIAGQFAGAYYGLDGIPSHLIDGLAKKDLIERYLNPIL